MMKGTGAEIRCGEKEQGKSGECPGEQEIAEPFNNFPEEIRTGNIFEHSS